MAPEVSTVVDLGCGTGAAGAAWALEAGGVSVAVRSSPWAVGEAVWTSRTLGLPGGARQADVTRLPLRLRRGSGVNAAYTVNELPPAGRAALLPRLLEAGSQQARACWWSSRSRRTATPWWDEWVAAFTAVGGEAKEWRFPVSLPERQRQLARAAGLEPRELTARSLWL